MLRPLAAGLFALALSLPAEADVMAAGALLGRPLQDLHGKAVGTVEDVIVDARERFYTLPIRALRERPGGLRLDMSGAGEIAKFEEPRTDPRFRRAARLIGQPLEHPGGGRIGTIKDVEFDPAKGRVPLGSRTAWCPILAKRACCAKRAITLTCRRRSRRSASGRAPSNIQRTACSAQGRKETSLARALVSVEAGIWRGKACPVPASQAFCSSCGGAHAGVRLHWLDASESRRRAAPRRAKEAF